MKYRATKDFIATDQNGNKSLVAWGDKVFVIENEGPLWEAFSFKTRQSLGSWTTKECLDKHFAPEETFRRDSNKSDRKPFKRIIPVIVLLLLTSLGGVAQTSPIAWSWKAVRVDQNYLEVHINADMFRGWWLYKPNSQNVCPYSPLITFERSEGVKAVENVDVIRYVRSDTDLPVDVHAVPPLCPLAQFSGGVTFVQIFKMPINKSGTVRGKIVYCAMSTYMYEEARTIEFELKVGEEQPDETVYVFQKCSGNQKILTTYPKGIFRKTWWFIRHPFGKQYITRQAIP